MKEIMEDIHSPAEFAEKFINQTNQSVFLTGKAGTGKTTLLKKIIASTHKNTVVVAPTGIAAINAGGVTIHSFFQLPFGGFIPIDGPVPYHRETLFNTCTTLLKNQFKIRKNRRQTINRLELLIIDEVSMLRADLLDAIDFTLQKIRRNSQPFGGVQVLFIGDLFQLPPIVTRSEEDIFSKYYKSSFFFNAKVLEKNPPLYIELEKIHRQSDPIFIGILEELRNNQISNKSIQILNQYVNPNFDSSQHEGYITITTHNAKADKINQKLLDGLEGNIRKYEAKISKNFPESNYPIPPILELKVGAQVMFIKNDSSYEKRYFNGKIGRVMSLDSDEIKVLLPEENKIINVTPFEWENKRFDVDETSGEITEKVIGTFTFFPLKLAWAITVHKSQGLTFEKAVIDLSEVFAPGQAYVGLSRMTGLEGLVLKNPIQLNGLQNEKEVVNYAQNKAELGNLEKSLYEETQIYLQSRLQKTFNWDSMVSKWFQLESLHYSAGEKSVLTENIPWIKEQVNELSKTLEPSKKFRDWILRYCIHPQFNLDYLHERMNAAYHYFLPLLETSYKSNIEQILIVEKLLGTKQYVESLLEIDELMTQTIIELKKSMKLVESLAIGNELSKINICPQDLLDYRIIKVQDVKEELRRKNPTIEQWGEKNSILQKTKKKKEIKPKKTPTHLITLELFKKGYTISEIADRRIVQEATIYNHLYKLILEGEIKIEDVLPTEKINFMKERIGQNTLDTASEMKERVGDEISWEELKLFRAYLLQ